MIRKYEEPIGDVESIDDGIVWFEPDAWEALFDRRARETMGISAAEFRERYRNGEFDACDRNVIMLSFFLFGSDT